MAIVCCYQQDGDVHSAEIRGCRESGVCAPCEVCRSSTESVNLFVSLVLFQEKAYISPASSLRIPASISAPAATTNSPTPAGRRSLYKVNVLGVTEFGGTVVEESIEDRPAHL